MRTGLPSSAGIEFGRSYAVPESGNSVMATLTTQNAPEDLKLERN
jgi:hypothetical protein